MIPKRNNVHRLKRVILVTCKFLALSLRCTVYQLDESIWVRELFILGLLSAVDTHWDLTRGSGPVWNFIIFIISTIFTFYFYDCERDSKMYGNTQTNIGYDCLWNVIQKMYGNNVELKPTSDYIWASNKISLKCLRVCLF